MKAVMMNPARPERETKIVDCGKAKHVPQDEVGRFSGRTGGSIKITAELWDWIHNEQQRQHDRIYRENIETGAGRILPKKEEIIRGIQSELAGGGYNDEQIFLGYSTIEKILTDRYQEMLKDGFPADEKTLTREQLDREMAATRTRAELEASENYRRAMAQIYLKGRDDISRVIAAFEATDVEEVFDLFPNVSWPVKQDGSMPTLTEAKDLIKQAMKLKITRVRKPPRQERMQRQRFASAEDAEFPED